MKIAGFIKNSFIDFPKHISSVIFTQGCNFDCWYCHNREIISEDSQKIDLIEDKVVFEFLETRKGKIDGLVISGGEPTLQSDLIEFVAKIKQMGFLVKLDTNGTNPEVLEKLLEDNLLDFVAMDIKTSFDKYQTFFQKNAEIFIKNVKKSVNLLKNSKINYEFRTTFSPDVLLSDIEQISRFIQGAKSYAIQKYRPVNEKVVLIPHTYRDYENAIAVAKKYVSSSFLRGM